MSKPIVAVVGRPNVGKSTLFNDLAGQQISIVKDTPGVTRDRIYAEVTWLDKSFTLIDTGGIEPDTSDVILAQMREQAEIAIETADVIIFLTDVKQGLVDSDAKVADMLRRSRKPVILAVNKVDNFDKLMPDVYEFYNLGIGDPHPISAASKLGLGDMLDEVIKHFPQESETEEEDERPKVAIIGKPNVGKSSIINKLLGKNRVIVSNIAGTTRDAIDTTITYNKKEYEKLVKKIATFKDEGEMEQEAFEAFRKKFADAIRDDLNTSMALTIVYDVVKADISEKTKLALLNDFDQVLALNLTTAGQERLDAGTSVDAELEQFINEKIAERAGAKKAKDFARADAIRDELLARGITIKDTREGVVWERNA